MRGEEYPRPLRGPLIHHSMSGHFAIRDGQWKLNLFRGSGGRMQPVLITPKAGEPPFELYDMKNDWRETTNVHDKQPEVVERLKNLATKIVKDGRSTPGEVLKNDGPQLWSELTWIRRKELPAKADGHRVPFIARWPGHVKPESKSAYTCCLMDVFATAAEIVDAKIPEKAAEDSFSLLPVLLEKEPISIRKAIFVQGDTNDNTIAICTGRWKMIVAKNKENVLVNQLYDLSKDPGENTDLAKDHPDVVKELAAELEKARINGRTRK